MPEIIVAVLVVAALAFLVARAVRSDDPDRWLMLLAQVFFLALAIWVVAELLLMFDLGRGRLGTVIYPFFDLAQPASLVAKAAFVAMAFALMMRAYRRLGT